MKQFNNAEVELIGRYGNDMSVVNAARVSFDQGAEYAIPTEKDERLIHYLASHKHHSPFNHAFLSFRVKAPIVVARQLVKHKFMPYNEVSRRYVTHHPDIYVPPKWRGRPTGNIKQGSGELEGDCLTKQNFLTSIYLAATEEAFQAYDKLLNNGVAPEQARMVLPQGVGTDWIWSGTLGACLDMLVLRLPNDAQKESQEVAQKIGEVVQKIFPISFAAYNLHLNTRV